MLDFTRSDPRLLDGVDIVVGELGEKVGVDPNQVMLVGAECRDVLHSALGHEVMLRLTEDTDIAIALADWQIYEQIAHTFTRAGHTGVRYLVGGVTVDIMPFGAVESPEGVVTPRPHGEDMVVFGFDDVFGRALPLALPSGSKIRIPTVPGYTALKLRAWIDRSAYRQDKDGKDLAAAMFWYCESSQVAERLYDTDSGLALLERLGWDRDLGSAHLLGVDVGAQLTPENGTDLAARWGSVDRDFDGAH
jgi:predicted nucleotidyltransferase